MRARAVSPYAGLHYDIRVAQRRAGKIDIDRTADTAWCPLELLLSVTNSILPAGVSRNIHMGRGNAKAMCSSDRASVIVDRSETGGAGYD
jgi:hypothetical protein